jgi:hypothetical protein
MDNMTTGKASLTQVGKFNFYVEPCNLRYENDEVVIEVKGGWNTDGGSIPKIFHSIISPFGGLQLNGFLVHDALWLCRVYYNYAYPLEWTNKIMEEIHKDCGVSWWKRKLIRIGVSGLIARRKWDNPDDEVKYWEKDTVTLTVKEKDK